MTESLGTLLIVDDEEMNRDMLGRRLELEGFQVLAVESGAQALQCLADQRFDAVLLDVMMPDQNGYQVLTEIRKTFDSLELPVIMVTAKSQNENMVHAFASGANDYFTKPINFPVALARINSQLACKRLSSQLRESELRYALSAQGANDGLWDWDLVQNTIHLSPRWKSMLGHEEGEIGSAPDEWFNRVHSDDLEQLQRALAEHRAGRTAQFESEHRMLHRDQSYRWVLTRGVAIRGADGREVRMAGSQTDITRGKAADPLTGLPNRVLFMDHLAGAVRMAQEQSSHRFAVLFLDLDRFKIVNDSLGHLAGDELLVTVARRLESCLRSTDSISRSSDRCTVARFGGDEFVVLLNGLKQPEDACQVAERILRVVSEPLKICGHDVAPSTSIGIAINSESATNVEDLIRDADTAMYQAKSNGKSCYALFDPSMRTKAVRRLEMEADLKLALERNEFKVHYQPIVSLPAGKIKGFEALLRWQHAERGLIPPTEFIPVAEETGFILELGLWVLRQSCRQLCEWRQRYPEKEELFISVNVSSTQFAHPGFVDSVAACLAETGLDPSYLKLEITETAIMQDPTMVAALLGRLRATGARISIDDFGTGYSSLSYLQQFPIDTVKIDRSFVNRLGDSLPAGEIVRAIVALAHNLGMDVTAEGIEGLEQQSVLTDATCETGQGYLYSRPVPADDIDGLLTNEGAAPATDQSVTAPAALCFAPGVEGTSQTLTGSIPCV